MATLLGQPCCPALTVKMQTQVTAALRPAYDELAAQLPTQDHVSIDETATKECNGKAWLWTFVASAFTVYRAATHAGSDGAGRSAHGGVPRHRDLRSGQNVLAHRPFTMVLGAPDSRFSSA